MVLSWKMTSRLETHLLKSNILDLIKFASEYTTAGSSNLISIGTYAFTDGSWKIWGTLIRSARLFRKETLQILVGAFLLASFGFGVFRLDYIQSYGIKLKEYRIFIII